MSEKTFIYTPESGYGNNGFDPNLYAALNNGGGFGGNNGMWWIFLFALLWNRNGFGNFGGNCTPELSSTILSAVQGNRTAISELSSSLGCSVNQVSTVLSNIQNTIQNVGAQNNLSFAQTVNEIQAGNAAITNALQSCCCEIRENITKQGYESQLATLNQTNTLGSKIDAQTTFLSDKFCELEKRELQNKIDSLREANSTLKGQLDNAAQTQQIQGFVAATTQPIAAAVASLQSDVDGIKCKLPQTVNIPYSPVVGIPSCAAFNAGLYGNGFGLFGNNGAGIFG